MLKENDSFVLQAFFFYNGEWNIIHCLVAGLSNTGKFYHFL